MFAGRRVLTVLNPTSGARRGADLAEELEADLRGHGASDAVVRVTAGPDDAPEVLLVIMRELQSLLADNKRIIVHRDELGDHVIGLMAAYLRWTGLVQHNPEVVTVIERITQRQLGPTGREIVAQAAELAADESTSSTLGGSR